MFKTMHQAVLVPSHTS